MQEGPPLRSGFVGPSGECFATQDWLPVRDVDGRFVAKAEGEWNWRDEDRSVLLYLLFAPEVRGKRLETLNKNGLVLVEIKEKLLRITVIDSSAHITYRFQWLNLWGTVVPRHSSYHLSEDYKRIVVRLRKVHDSFAAGTWGSFLDVRTGTYYRAAMGWANVLCEIQGAWRSEEEEPIEVVGHQVVWPEGSRDVLVLDESTETFKLGQTGDGDKIAASEYEGFYDRRSHTIRWDDGDQWSRIPGLMLKREEAGRKTLPLEYNQQLARWVPWLPPQEFRRQATHWMPPLEPEVSIKVMLAATTVEASSDGSANHSAPVVKLPADIAMEKTGKALGGIKSNLLDSIQCAGEDILLVRFDALPSQLLTACRICALSASDMGTSSGEGLARALLSLRDGRPVSPSNEAAAIGGLVRWLQWLRCWLAPSARQNLECALESLREKQFQASKEEHRLPADQRDALLLSRCQSCRWPPTWSCCLTKPNDLLELASKRLMLELRRLCERCPSTEAYTCGLEQDPNAMFGQARRKVAEVLLDEIHVDSVSRRCDALEKRWSRRYAQEAAKNLFTGRSAAMKTLRRELCEGGFALVEDILDWGTLIKIKGETQRLIGGDLPEASARVFSSGLGGYARWVEVSQPQLHELGMLGLSTAVGLLQQLPFCLNDAVWAESGAEGSGGFGGRRWTCDGEVFLWHYGGCRAQNDASNLAIEWPGSSQESYVHEEVPGDHKLTALLFLNTPAWRPEWGGALRCHIGPISRDVWGDGGRLVLLKKANAFELLPSTQTHTVLLLHLSGTLVRGAASSSSLRTRNEFICEPWRVKELQPTDHEKVDVEPEVQLQDPEIQRLEIVQMPQPEGGHHENGNALDVSPIFLDSHEVIELFEGSLPKAFKVD
eukprot:TRINITY_DN23385_c0_g1_i1.p1 TRINITY_DN23385_c0_g1~~TRINITY_DN23385_c0_g1_i1.p1  ORF type:complete len:886 (-),score=128.03 TRINITY_DN23385_c0_g1_i1:119-2776(-)